MALMTDCSFVFFKLCIIITEKYHVKYTIPEEDGQLHWYVCLNAFAFNDEKMLYLT